MPAPGRWNHPREMTEPRRNYIPDFLFNFLNRARGIDHSNAVWLARRQLAVGEANRLVKFERLLFHPIDPSGGTDPPHHAGARRFDIDIEQKGEVRPARADREGIQMPNHLVVEPARDALVNGGGIGKAIGEDDGTPVEGRLDNFPNELAPARLEEKQLGFWRHRDALRGELQKVPDFFPDRRPARFAGDEEGNARFR